MAYEQNPWHNEFVTPSIKELRAGVRELDVKLFDRMRKRMGEREDLVEGVEWYAEPWFWTISYRIEDLPDPLLIIVPSQIDLQAAMPIDRDLAEQLAAKPLRRSIQEGLSLVREPFDTRWCVWSLIGSGMVDDLSGLLDIKRESMQLPA